MKYPKEVLTKSKTGKIEARILEEEGQYYIYSYEDIASGKKENKTKLILKNQDKHKEFFLIPLKERGKFLALESEPKDEIAVWDPKTKSVRKII